MCVLWTCILPGIRLSAAVKISCLVLCVSDEVRRTLPDPALSAVARMNCCLGAGDGFIAVTIWIFWPVCWSVTIWGCQKRKTFVWLKWREKKVMLDMYLYPLWCCIGLSGNYLIALWRTTHHWVRRRGWYLQCNTNQLSKFNLNSFLKKIFKSAFANKLNTYIVTVFNIRKRNKALAQKKSGVRTEEGHF